MRSNFLVLFIFVELLLFNFLLEFLFSLCCCCVLPGLSSFFRCVVVVLLLCYSWLEFLFSLSCCCVISGLSSFFRCVVVVSFLGCYLFSFLVVLSCNCCVVFSCLSFVFFGLGAKGFDLVKFLFSSDLEFFCSVSFL